MWWHWLIKLYRLQVYISVTHHLYIALCVYHPKSNLLWSLYIGPSLPSTTSLWTPFSSGNYHAVCVSISFYLFLVRSFVTVSFISHIWVKLYDLTLSIWLILLRIIEFLNDGNTKVNSKFSHKNGPRVDGFACEYYQTLQEKINQS